MKFKISWGWGIVIAMGAFMIFILQFVYRAFTDEKLEHHLVSEDYYKDELYYQVEIDKMNNASKLDENVTVERTDNAMKVHFPKKMNQNNISGTIYFQRPSDKRIDFKRELEVIDNTMSIQDEKLINGRWNIKIDWKYGDEEYLFKKEMFY